MMNFSSRSSYLKIYPKIKIIKIKKDRQKNNN